jgi:hypothetical protein
MNTFGFGVTNKKLTIETQILKFQSLIVDNYLGFRKTSSAGRTYYIYYQLFPMASKRIFLLNFCLIHIKDLQ